MLNLAIKFLSDELQRYIVARTGSSSDEIVLPSAVVGDDGKFAIKEDTVGISLINMEEETTVKSQRRQYVPIDGQHFVLEPDTKLNLYVMFTANFRVYVESLKFVSHVITFFQTHPIFTAQQFPSLDPKIDRLTVEMQSLNYEQLNQIWAYIGGKHLPSVVYKVRILVVQDQVVQQVQPPIHEVSSRVATK